MKKRYLLALSLGLVCTCSIEALAKINPIRFNHSYKLMRGWDFITNKPGNWVQDYRNRYEFQFDEAAINNLYARELGLVPTFSKLTKIVQQLANGNLTESALEADVAAQKAQLKPYIINNACEWISDWKWERSKGPTKYKGMRDWNYAELEKAFGPMPGWKMKPECGTAGLDACLMSQTARCLGEAYRFLKLAQLMRENKLDSIYANFVFSIQGDDGINVSFDGKKPTKINPGNRLWTLSRLENQRFESPGGSLTRYTVNKLTPQMAQDIARELYGIAARCGSPIALDLNHDGIISVTGNSSAKDRTLAHQFVPEGSVMFDLDACGKQSRYEWLKGTDDGFLINDRDGAITKAIATNGEVDGKVLFGNAGGYENGYYKLTKFFDLGAAVASTELPTKPDGILRGKELDGLKVWIDNNHDAKVQRDEIKTLDSLGITELTSRFHYECNDDGEVLMRSNFIQNGQNYITEDVWFAIDPAFISKGSK